MSLFLHFIHCHLFGGRESWKIQVVEVRMIQCSFGWYSFGRIVRKHLLDEKKKALIRATSSKTSTSVYRYHYVMWPTCDRSSNPSQAYWQNSRPKQKEIFSFITNLQQETSLQPLFTLRDISLSSTSLK